jgi:hypothetical protein
MCFRLSRPGGMTHSSIVLNSAVGAESVTGNAAGPRGRLEKRV